MIETTPTMRRAVPQGAAQGQRFLEGLPLLLLTLGASLFASACSEGGSRVLGVNSAR